MSTEYDTAAIEDKTEHISVTDEEALELHRSGRPGKIEITPTKPLTTQRDLSLAYSPGVAAPCLAIRDDPNKAFDYTAKGNLVAVISNGTAVLGLGNLGALGAKPVMEGKVGPVQALCRHRRDRPRGRHRRGRSLRRMRAPARADLRRHQPRGHPGAQLLHHRTAPARMHGHPGVP